MDYPIQIVAIHSRLIKEGYNVSPHSHNFYQWYYVHEGEISYRAENERWILKNSDCVLMTPGVTREINSVHKMVRYTVIGFEVRGIHVPKFISRQMHLGPSLRQEAGILMDEIANPGFHYSSLFLHSILNRIILELFREIELSNSSLVDAGRQKTELAAAIDQFLFLNLANPVSREDVSKYCGFSSVHTARVYKEVTGKTIVARLTELRLQEAEQMLLNSDIPITEIALGVGFNSFSHFTQLFKKNVGVSPSEYREKHRMK